MILTVGAEKGGVGKSTVAANLAAWRADQERSVLLIDTDKMGSMQQWNAARKELTNVPQFTCVGVRGNGLGREVRELAAKFDDVVIDAGGSDSPELRGAMAVADVLVTPCKPGQFDIFSAFTMDRLVGEAQAAGNERLRALMLANDCPTNTHAELQDMLEALADMKNYTIADVVLYSRKAYRLTARDSRAVTEYYGREIDPKAVAEMRDLAKLVWGQTA